MSILYNYFFNYQTETTAEKETGYISDEFTIVEPDKKYLITLNDLKSVGLKHTKDVIAAPSRNMPLINTLSLLKSNKAQLEEIMNIKLKPVKLNIKPVYYPPRHPVIRELNDKFGIGKIISGNLV